MAFTLSYFAAKGLESAGKKFDKKTKEIAEKGAFLRQEAADNEANIPQREGARVRPRNKKERKAAYERIMAADDPFVHGSFGQFPAKFTLHLGQIGSEDISATYWLRDEADTPFLAMTGYYHIYGRLLTLRSSVDLNSPVLGVVDTPKASRLSYSHTMTIPGLSEASSPSTIDVPFTKAKYRFQVDVDQYEWDMESSKSPRTWKLVRLRDQEVLCKAQEAKQPRDAEIKDGITLRGAITFEGKGLLHEELSQRARLAVVLTGLDRCHEAINLRLAMARC